MIIVCSLKDVPEVCESVKPKYLISVIDPGYAPETPKSVQKHLKLGFDDILEMYLINLSAALISTPLFLYVNKSFFITI